MIGLKRDFIHNGKAMMTVDKSGDFLRNEISEVQLQMLISNVIPGHLTMSIKEINQVVTFNYDITGKKMLSQTAKNEKLSLNELFQMLLQISQTLLTCPQYMLDEQRYVLHEEYIFTTDTLEESKVFLCYIPAQIEEKIDPVSIRLNQMVIRMMPYIKALEGSGIQRILQLCNDSNFQLATLQDLLMELLMKEIGDKPSVRTQAVQDMAMPQSSFASRSQVDSQNPINGSGNAVSLLQKSAAVPSSQIPSFSDGSGPSSRSSIPFNTYSSEPMGSLRPDVGAASLSQPLLFNKGDVFSNEISSAEEEETDTQPSKPIYYWLGGLLVASVVWRFLYMDEPTTGRLATCAVLTLILAAAAYMLSTGKLKIGKKNKKDDFVTNTNSSDDRYASSPLFPGQKKESSHFELGRRGIFGGGDKNKENAEPWRWNIQTQQDEFIGEISKDSPSISPLSQGTKEPSISFTVPEELENAANETAASYYESLRHNTQLLNSSHAQATVLLTDSVESAGMHTQSAVLHLKKGYLERQPPHGAAERIELNTGSFIIGRSHEVSQFVEEGKGTSRAHIEISKSKEQYCIKDLNSMNGTLLLDKPMVPYKEYPLEEGDFFIIAESKYTFRYV